MGEFFKPWRRKIGVVTLVVAWVFATGWVRTMFVFDQIVVLTGSSFLILNSDQNGIEWEWHSDNSRPNWFPIRAEWDSVSAEKIDWFDPLERHHPFLRFDLWGFHIGTQDYRLLVVIVPYWLVVVPLTLLSAWLLLSKPRTPYQKKNTDPIHVNGA